MVEPIKATLLPNGLTVSFFSHNRHYYGDFHLVKLEIYCKIAVCIDYLGSEMACDEARALLGDGIEYRRYVQQMAVPTAEIKKTMTRLVNNFEQHSLSYFAAPEFPRKLIMAESKKSRLKSQPISPVFIS